MSSTTSLASRMRGILDEARVPLVGLSVPHTAPPTLHQLASRRLQNIRKQAATSNGRHALTNRALADPAQHVTIEEDAELFYMAAGLLIMNPADVMSGGMRLTREQINQLQVFAELVSKHLATVQTTTKATLPQQIRDHLRNIG